MPRSVEFCHPLDFCELDCVAVLEAVPGVVDRGNDSFVGDARHRGGGRLNAVDVENDEFFAEVGKDLSEQASGVGNDEWDIVCPKKIY